jgi:hypothetical protein
VTDFRDLDALIKDWFSYWRKVGSASRADRLAANSRDRLDDWFFESLFLRDGRPADEAVWPVVVALVEMTTSEKGATRAAATAARRAIRLMLSTRPRTAMRARTRNGRGANTQPC